MNGTARKSTASSRQLIAHGIRLELASNGSGDADQEGRLLTGYLVGNQFTSAEPIPERVRLAPGGAADKPRIGSGLLERLFHVDQPALSAAWRCAGDA